MAPPCKLARRFVTGVLSAFLAFAAGPACSSDSHDRGAGNAGGHGGSSASGNHTPIAVGTSGGTTGQGSTGNAPSGLGTCDALSFDGCTGEGFEGESVPLDIYILFDTSGSMLNDVGGMTRLQAIQRAAAEFLRDSASRGIGVGIGYFGFQPIGSTSCDEQAYATPAVGISTDHEAVIASLEAQVATGETPTAPALRAACDYGRAEKLQNPGRALVILLMTDGKPEAPVSCGVNGCCPTLDDAVAAAADCASGTRGLPTYVLGVGPELDNLDQIAAAGKTRAAYLVGNDDVTAKVLQALNSIRGDATVPCQLAIPPASDGRALNYSQVNLVYSTSGCDFVAAYYVDSPASCDDTGGWYYDDPNAPATVELCPATCADVSIPGAALRFSVGCATLPKPVR
ncbi:MAG TPA: VWA domain-containing protein [Polyangiaceae bacterium]|nr:VWA domain-containing protein [Polyangiaceae bacterium]